jgi:hypothetical protein
MVFTRNNRFNSIKDSDPQFCHIKVDGRIVTYAFVLDKEHNNLFYGAAVYHENTKGLPWIRQAHLDTAYDRFRRFAVTVTDFKYEKGCFRDAISQLYKTQKNIAKLDNKYSIIQPYTKEEKDISIEFAFLKLLHPFVTKDLPKITFYINKVKNINKELKILYNEHFNLIDNKKYSKCTRDIITRTNLNYIYSKKYYHMLYKNSKPIDLIKNVCIAQYFSIDGYYTPSAFNVIVLELQGKKKIKLKKIDYICSVIENLGNFIHNIDDELKLKNIHTKQILLKYSKYIYRIYYSLAKASTNKKFIKKTEQIRKQIIPHRKDLINIGNLNFKLLDYNHKNLHNYTEEFIDNILHEIEKLL